MKISHPVVAMSICLSAVSEGVFGSAIFIYAEKSGCCIFSGRPPFNLHIL